MFSTNDIPLQWWEGSGFLYGPNPTLDVDDPMRISTNVFQIPPTAQEWQPLATGMFNIPASVDGAPPTAPLPHSLKRGGWSAFNLTDSETYLAETNPPSTCKANCTLGGCSDPTSAVHEECVEAGCCDAQPLNYDYVPSKNVSQMGYGDMDCTLGPGTYPGDPDGYCKSQYTYKQCNPGSAWEAWQDPRCYASTTGKPVPFYVVF